LLRGGESGSRIDEAITTKPTATKPGTTDIAHRINAGYDLQGLGLAPEWPQ